MKRFFLNLLSGTNETSSKRFIALICTGVIIIIAFANLFLGLTISEFIFNGILTIVLVGLGAVLGENIVSMINKPKND